MAAELGLDARCPRCAGAFHCGANDAEPCACCGLQLPAELLAALRQRYTGCLCLNCLRELAASSGTNPATQLTDSRHTANG